MPVETTLAPAPRAPDKDICITIPAFLNTGFLHGRMLNTANWINKGASAK